MSPPMEARPAASDWRAHPSSQVVKQEERAGGGAGGAGGDAMEVESVASPHACPPAATSASIAHGWAPPGMPAAAPIAPAAPTAHAHEGAALGGGSLGGAAAAAAASGLSTEAGSLAQTAAVPRASVDALAHEAAGGAEAGQATTASALSAPGLCSRGHPLVLNAVEAAGLKCDMCGLDIPVGESTYSCEPCDFDQCSRCAGQRS